MTVRSLQYCQVRPDLHTCKNINFHKFTGIRRDSDEWISLYKIKTIVERTINHYKINIYVTGHRTRNHTTTKADVFLAGITRPLTVIVAFQINYPQYIRSLKLLVSWKKFNCHTISPGLFNTPKIFFYFDSGFYLNHAPYVLSVSADSHPQKRKKYLIIAYINIWFNFLNTHHNVKNSLFIYKWLKIRIAIYFENIL